MKFSFSPPPPPVSSASMRFFFFHYNVSSTSEVDAYSCFDDDCCSTSRLYFRLSEVVP